MNTIKIKLSWHKINSPTAMTFQQLKFIEDLLNDENCPDWPFNSVTNAMRQLTKADASVIIDALKNGDIVIFEK